MSGADLWEDGYPHGTVEGYDGGCRGGSCPAGVEHGLSCKRAKALAAGDYRYKRLVKDGLKPAEIAEALKEDPHVPPPAPTRPSRDITLESSLLTTIHAGKQPTPKPAPTPEPTPESEAPMPVDEQPTPKPRKKSKPTAAPAEVLTAEQFTTGLTYSQKKAKLQEIRTWSREHGHDVPVTGRIPQAALRAYQLAHPSPEQMSSFIHDAIAPDELLEQGRKLASERDDLVADGVNPADLDVPLAPTTLRPDDGLGLVGSIGVDDVVAALTSPQTLGGGEPASAGPPASEQESPGSTAPEPTETPHVHIWDNPQGMPIMKNADLIPPRPYVLYSPRDDSPLWSGPCECTCGASMWLTDGKIPAVPAAEEEVARFEHIAEVLDETRERIAAPTPLESETLLQLRRDQSPEWADVTIPEDVGRARTLAARLEEDNARLAAQLAEKIAELAALSAHVRDLRRDNDTLTRALPVVLRRWDEATTQLEALAGIEQDLDVAADLANQQEETIVQLEQTIQDGARRGWLKRGGRR
ncbi:Lsr2 family DNA-binding protein [Microbacterium sp.]|uniref:Lsr2 family DNA-binding protein n=1 Tax=Microbacterium sp. TaxID=51671 RepID=UPI003F71AF40